MVLRQLTLIEGDCQKEDGGIMNTSGLKWVLLLALAASASAQHHGHGHHGVGGYSNSGNGYYPGYHGGAGYSHGTHGYATNPYQWNGAGSAPVAPAPYYYQGNYNGPYYPTGSPYSNPSYVYPPSASFNGYQGSGHHHH